MKKTTRITLICIIAILLLAIIGGTIFAYVHKYAYAEYDDLTNTDIVNFNQQILLNSSPYNTITIINGQGFVFDTYSSNSYIDFRAQIYSNHKYYCYISNPITSNIELTVNGVPLIVVNNQYGIYTPNQSGLCDRLYLISGFTAGTYYINLIDLSQMFGNGNEPTLVQCQELFTADYYSYNTGTPMFYGRSQMGNSYILDYPATTGNLKPNGTSANTLKVDYVQDGGYGTSLALYSNNSNPEQYLDYFLWNLDTTFTAGSIITITANDYIVKGALSLVANNSMQQVLTSFENSNQSDTRRNLSYTFVVQEDFSSFWLVGEPLNASLTTPYAKFPFLQISVQYVNDIPSLIQGAKSLGITEGESHYAYGTDGYNEIFNAGKQYALQHNSNNAWGSAWDFIESAFTGIGGLFAIEILPNVPLSVFILTPLMVILIFFIVKLVKGGS